MTRLGRRIFCAAVAVLILADCRMIARGSDVKPVKMTGYCINGIMANGEKTHEGVCAYRKEDIGKIAILYNAEMVEIGRYEISDTGSKPVRKGYVVDVWFPTKEECYAFTQKGYIEVVEKPVPEELEN